MMTPVIKRVLTKRVPFYSLIFVALMAGLCAYLFQFCCATRTSTTSPSPAVDCTSELSQVRIGGPSLVRSLVMADIAEESKALAPVKQRVLQSVDEARQAHQVSEVSVYFRRMNDGAWFCVNPNQSYNPASLIKVTYLIAFLKEAEETPGLLDRKIHFDRNDESYKQNIAGERLRENQDYSIRTLLEYMIQFSDNNATVLLQSRVNYSVYNNIFSDLGIQVPDFSKEYFITPADMSKFFRVLYNGTYLSKSSSEYALKLLTRSTFRDGLVGGIDDPKVVVAHKFGERVIGNTAQLHEFGIVYAGNEPYLIGIMSSGSDQKALSEVMKKISKEVYQVYRSYFGV
jgi:beta-lactamase class A